MATEREFLAAYNTLDSELHRILGRPFKPCLIKAFSMILKDPKQSAQLDTIRKYRNNVIGHGANLVEITVPDGYVQFLDGCIMALKKKPEIEIRKELEEAIRKIDKHKDKKYDNRNNNNNNQQNKDLYAPADVDLTKGDNKLAFEQTYIHGVTYNYSITRKKNNHHILIINKSTNGKVYIYTDDFNFYCTSNATRNYKIRALISGSGFTDKFLGGHFFDMDDYKTTLKVDKRKALHYSNKNGSVISIKIWFNHGMADQQIFVLNGIDLDEY